MIRKFLLFQAGVFAVVLILHWAGATQPLAMNDVPSDRPARALGAWSEHRWEQAGFSVQVPASAHPSGEVVPTIHGDVIFQDTVAEYRGVRYLVGFAPLPP